MDGHRKLNDDLDVLTEIRLFTNYCKFCPKYLPSLTTAIPASASGTLTPAAINVNPITVSGIINVEPIIVIIQTIMYEYMEIQTIAIRNVSTKEFAQASFRQSKKKKKDDEPYLNSEKD